MKRGLSAKTMQQNKETKFINSHSNQVSQASKPINNSSEAHLQLQSSEVSTRRCVSALIETQIAFSSKTRSKIVINNSL